MERTAEWNPKIYKPQLFIFGKSLSLSIVTTTTFQCSFYIDTVKLKPPISCEHIETPFWFFHIAMCPPLQLVTLCIDPITERWTFRGNDHNHSISCPVISVIDGGHLCKYGGGGGGGGGYHNH